jgi:pyruvate dehydrogenase (quinone)
LTGGWTRSSGCPGTASTGSSKYARACGLAGFTLDDPDRVEETLREAFEQPDAALIEAVVDSLEPPMPGNVSLEQSLHFAEALVRGQKDRWGIIKTIVENKVREVI